MMSALGTAATGMMAQQTNVDVISNNLANVNTTGYKKERVEFKDLLYDTMSRAYLLNGKGRPVNLQVGHGATAVATVKNYDSGTVEKTDSEFDFSIDGEAFFQVAGPKDQTVFTRDGSFKLVVAADNTKRLVTSDGFPILDSNGNNIILNTDTTKVIVSSDGTLNSSDVNGNATPLGVKLGLVKFANRQGLESVGKNFFAKTSASGDPVPDDSIGVKSVISQGFLEASNVQVIEEMVKLIVAQRAYEVNSKAIQSADEMLGMANNLRKG